MNTDTLQLIRDRMQGVIDNCNGMTDQQFRDYILTNCFPAWMNFCDREIAAAEDAEGTGAK